MAGDQDDEYLTNPVSLVLGPERRTVSPRWPLPVKIYPETMTAYLYAPIAASASGATTIIGPMGGRIRVIAMQLIASAAVNVKWQSHLAPLDLTGLAYLAANGGYVLPLNERGWFQTNSNEALDINLSGAVAVGGSITYVAA